MGRYCPKCNEAATGNPLRFTCPDCGTRLRPTDEDGTGTS